MCMVEQIFCDEKRTSTSMKNCLNDRFILATKTENKYFHGLHLNSSSFPSQKIISNMKTARI